MQHLLLTDIDLCNYKINDIVDLNDVHSKHIYKVLRMKHGDLCSISDGKGSNFITKIKELGDTVSLQIEKIDDEKRELNIDITVFQGVPKGDKIETIVQKVCELGAKEFTPVNMIRSISVIEDRKKEKKISRLQIIADNASNQSKRQYRMKVSNPIVIKKINFEEFDKIFIAYEDEKENAFSNYISTIKEGDKVAILLGPEGGIDKSELSFLKEKSNVYIVHLGKRILRTETAALTMLAHIMMSFDK